MISPEMLRRVRRIEIKTRRLVRSAFAGAYHSAYKGRGITFSAVRPYVPGDDVRSIDWKITARSMQPYVKQYVEERELTLMVVLDGSASLFFGSSGRQKREIAAEFASILALVSTVNQDRAGLTIFTEGIEHYLPPQRSRNHILRIIRDVLAYTPRAKGSDLGKTLRHLDRLLRPGAIIFVVSDFLLPVENYQNSLRQLGQRHDVVTVLVNDPLEEKIPQAGLMRLQDAESGAIVWADSRSAEWQRRFSEQRSSIVAARDKVLKQARAGRIELPPDGDFMAALTTYFHQRAHERRSL